MNRLVLGLCALVISAPVPANAEPQAADPRFPAVTGSRPWDNAPPSAVPLPTIIRPGPSTRKPESRTLVYRADQRGQVKLTAMANGAPVRFVVDTGADLVGLTLEDARAAGFDPDALIFNVPTRTANGMGFAARVMLREIRINELSIYNVPALVETNLSAVSLLGMSFLRRVRFEMREDRLTISW